MAQLVEHRSANAEATGSNPVEAGRNLFFGLLRNCLKLRFNCDGHIFISSVFPQFTSFHTGRSITGWAYKREGLQPGFYGLHMVHVIKALP